MVTTVSCHLPTRCSLLVFLFLVNLKSLLMRGKKKGFIFVQKKNSVPTKMGHKGAHSFVYILDFSSLYKKDSLTLAY